MIIYRLNFVDHGGNVFSTTHFRAPDDEAAIAEARQLHIDSIGNGFELWQDDRHVLTERRPPAAGPVSPRW